MGDDDQTERGCILEDDPLNSAAFYATLGFSTNRERALINLLRSDRPIDPLVREALASALEGDAPYGSVLRFSGAEGLRTKASSIQARREWMTIGDWISGERENGRKYDNAIVMAAGKFNCSQKKCEHALSYRNLVLRWVEENDVQGTVYGSYGVERLLETFHEHHAEGKILKGNRDKIEADEEEYRDMLQLVKAMGLQIADDEIAALSRPDAE